MSKMRPSDGPGASKAGRDRTLIFQVGDGRHGLPLKAVVEVFEASTPPTPVPGAPPWVGGLINHHGWVIPLIRMGAFLGMEPDRGSKQVILVDLAEERIGLLVEQIVSLEEVRAKGPRLQGRRRSWHRGALLELVEPSQLADDIRDRLDELRKGTEAVDLLRGP